MSHIPPVSFGVLSTLAAYRIVSPVSSTSYKVQYREAAVNPIIGVTVDTVKDTTLSIPVAVAGIAKCYFNDSCAAGQVVGTDTSGRGIAFGAFALTVGAGATGTSSYIGFALEGLTGASCTGTLVDVLIMPGFARVAL